LTEYVTRPWNLREQDVMVLIYMGTKELGWKENHEIPNTGAEESKGNIILNKEKY
jgi:hypothetical protein